MLPNTDDVITNMTGFPPFWPNNDPNLENGLPNPWHAIPFFSSPIRDSMVPFILTRKRFKNHVIRVPLEP